MSEINGCDTFYGRMPSVTNSRLKQSRIILMYEQNVIILPNDVDLK